MKAVRAECTLASSLSSVGSCFILSLITADFAVHQNAKEVTLTQFRDTIYRLSYEASSLVEDGWMNWRGRWSHNQFPFPFRFQWQDEREEGGSGAEDRRGWQCHLPSFFLLFIALGSLAHWRPSMSRPLDVTSSSIDSQCFGGL